VGAAVSPAAAADGSALLSPLPPARDVEKPRSAATRSAPDGHTKRTYIAREILETEVTYVEGLAGLLEEFDKPLRRVLKQEESRAIFSNIHALVGFHQVLRSELEARMADWHETQKIGDLLVKLTPYLRMYSTYINSFDEVNDMIERLKKKNTQFKLLLPECKYGIHDGDLGLSSLLLTPIQRVPRYVMLLRDLLKNTDAEHPDHTDLSKALTSMEEIGQLINERKRQDEQSKRIAGLSKELSKALHNSPHKWFRHRTERELQCADCKKPILVSKKCYTCDVCGHNTHLACQKKDGICGDEEDAGSLVKHNRQFIREGPAQHRRVTLAADGVSTNSFAKEVKNKRDCVVFLFNDSLLVVYPVGGATEKSSSALATAAAASEVEYKLCSMIRWYSATTNRDVELKTVTPTSFSIYPPREFAVHTLLFENEADAKKWFADIEVAIVDWREQQARTSGGGGAASSSSSSSPLSGGDGGGDADAGVGLQSPATIAGGGLDLNDNSGGVGNDGKMFLIPATAPVPGTGGKFTAYVMLINEPGKEPRTVLKRYSQFFDLNQALKRLGIKKQLPAFPKKKWLGNTDPKFVKKRREKLQAYMNNLTPAMLNLPIVKRFLTTGVEDSVSDMPDDEFYAANQPLADAAAAATSVSAVVDEGGSSSNAGAADISSDDESAQRTPRAAADKPARSPDAIAIAYGLWDFTSEASNEMSFLAGDRLEILQKDEDGWWSARNCRNGLVGDVPETFLKDADDE
jgi:RhoGEF domain/PX domain/SH3 domain